MGLWVTDGIQTLSPTFYWLNMIFSLRQTENTHITLAGLTPFLTKGWAVMYYVSTRSH